MNRFNDRGTRTKRFGSSESRPFQKPRFPAKPYPGKKNPGFKNSQLAGLGESLTQAQLEAVKRNTIAAQAGMSKPSMIWLRTTSGAIRFVRSYGTGKLAVEALSKVPVKPGEFAVISATKPTEQFIQDNLTNPQVVRAGV